MKFENSRRLLATTAAALSMMVLPLVASAVPLTGGIGFGGIFTPTGGTDLSDATGLDIGFSSVQAATLDFSPTVGQDTNSGLSWENFQFSPLSPDPVSPLWSINLGGGNVFSFDLHDVSVDFQDSDQLNLSGSGILMATGFDDTVGEWFFSGDSAGKILFSFSSVTIAAGAVPEPGTLLLLGIGLAGLSVSRRRAAR